MRHRFEPGQLPGAPEGNIRLSDMANYEELWDVAKRVYSACGNRMLWPGWMPAGSYDAFVSVHGLNSRTANAYTTC